MGISLAVGGALLSTATSAYGQYKAGKAQEKAAKARAAIARKNGSLARERARDAERTGQQNAQLVQAGMAQEIGASIASAAARGVVVNQGSAASLVQDIQRAGETDRLSALQEGERRARDLRSQGADFDANADLSIAAGEDAGRAAFTSALSTVTQGVAGVHGKWSAYRAATASNPAGVN